MILEGTRASRSQDPLYLLERRELQAHVQDLLSGLSDRERTALEWAITVTPDSKSITTTVYGQNDAAAADLARDLGTTRHGAYLLVRQAYGKIAIQASKDPGRFEPVLSV